MTDPEWARPDVLQLPGEGEGARHGGVLVPRLHEQRHAVVLEGAEDEGLLDVGRPGGGHGEELPGEGVLLVLEHVPADLHREGGAVRDLHVPGDGQGAEPLQVPGDMILVSSSSSWPGLCHLMTFSALSSVMQYTRMVFIQARGKFSR